MRVSNLIRLLQTVPLSRIALKITLFEPWAILFRLFGSTALGLLNVVCLCITLSSGQLQTRIVPPVRIALSNVPAIVVRIRHIKGYFAVALRSKHPTSAYLRHYPKLWLLRISLLQFHTVWLA